MKTVFLAVRMDMSRAWCDTSQSIWRLGLLRRKSLYKHVLFMCSWSLTSIGWIFLFQIQRTLVWLYFFLLAIHINLETFLQDLLEILKRMLQNFQKIQKKCFFGTANNLWVTNKCKSMKSTKYNAILPPPYTIYELDHVNVNNRILSFKHVTCISMHEVLNEHVFKTF